MRRVYGVAIISMVLLSAVLVLRASLPTVQTETWASAGEMGVARAGSTAVPLPDGRVMVIGGTDATGAPTASAEFFSPDGTWSAAPPMSMPRAGHAAMWLLNGEVLVTGGITMSGGGATNSAEIFDSISGHWTTLSSTMFAARSGHTMSQLGDGSVLIAGGRGAGGAVVNTLEVLQIAPTEQFTLAGTLQTGRFGHAADALQDGRVLIVGGSTLDANGNPVTLNSTEIFDPAKGVTAGPALNPPRTGASATTLLDGTVLIAGGSYPEGAAQGAPAELTNADIFNPADGSLNPAPAQLKQARSGHRAFLLPHNANVLIVGGTFNGSAIASVEQYTPWTGTMQATTMNAARAAGTGSPLNAENWYPNNDGLILIAGGKDANGAPQTSAELFRFAAVMTNKTDYSPGETVNITGSGWQPNEVVTLSFREQPSIDAPGPFTVTADPNGNIADSEFAPDANDLNVRFFLTAVGKTSGLQAQHTFTDANFPAPDPFIVTPVNATTMHLQWTNSTGTGGNATVWIYRWVADVGITSCSGASFPADPTISLDADKNNSTQTYDDTSLPAGLHNGQLVCYAIKIVRLVNGMVSRDGNFAYGFADVVLDTTTSINTSAITYNANGTVTVTVSSTGGTPTGNVSLTVDSTAASKALSGGSATFTSTDNAALASPSAGNHSLSASYAAQGDFGASTATGTLVVNPATLTVTVDNKSMPHGGPVPTLTGTLSGVVAGDNITATYSTTATASSDVGTYPITATLNDPNNKLGNYTVTNTPGTLTVNQASVTASVTASDKVYNGSAAATITGCSLTGVLFSDVVTCSAAGPNSFSDANVGSGKTVTATNISLGGANADNYQLSSTSATTTANITAAPVTATAGSYSGQYDGSSHAPTPACAVTGTYTGDLACTNDPASVGPDVSSGTVTPKVTGTGLTNFTITPVNGSYSITQATSTVTVSCPASVTYNGSAQTPCTATVTGAGGLSESLTVNYTNNTNAGTATASATFAGDTNHTGNSDSKTFTINPAPVTATAGSYSGTYDGVAHSPTACTVTGTYKGDLTCTNDPASVGPDVSSGTVTPKVTGTGLSNFAITPVNGSYSITPAAVTATAGNYSGVYDGSSHSPAPACAVTGTYTGDLSCTNSPASVGPDVGSGTITPNVTGAHLANFAITSVNGSWSITPRPVTITAGSYSGVYNGETHALSTCSSNYAGVTCTNSPAGPVGPDVGGSAVTPVPNYVTGNASDYTITSHNGSWSITPAPVTATAGSYSAAYDGVAHPPSACTVTGTYKGDLACTNDPASVGPDVSSGTVTPHVTGTGLSNFAITPVNGSWSITPAPVTATAGSYSATYDGVAHSPSACTVTGTYKGDLACTNDPASVGPDVSSGTVTPKVTGTGLSNFAITPVNGSWSITPAPVTATAGSYSATYDGVAHSPSACTVTGTYKGDLTCTNTPASVGAGVSSGTVTPNVSGTGLSNFTITPVNGSWSITPAPLTVAAGSYSGVYDGSSHPLSACTVSTNYDSLTCTNSPTGPVGPDVGSGTITAVISGDTSNYTVTKNAGSWSITQRPTTISLGITPSSVQYSDVVAFHITVASGGVPINGSVSIVALKGAATYSIASNLSVTTTPADFTITPQIMLGPGSYTLTAIFTPSGSNFIGSNAGWQPLNVTQEDAAVTYTGQSFWSVSSTETAVNVTVPFTLQDATATGVGSPIYDAYAGDITKTGTVNISISGQYFDANSNGMKNYNDNASCTNVPVAAVSGQVDPINGLPSTATTGSCTFNGVPVNGTYQVTIAPGTGSYYTFPGGYDTVVYIGITNGGGGFITGGGYQRASYLLANPSGAAPAGVLKNIASKTNFGYTAKYNKSGKNLQASVNIIVRAQCSSTQASIRALGINYTAQPGDDGLCLYQIKSNKVISMSDAPFLSAGSPGYGVLVVGANIQDVTGATPISLVGGGQLTLIMYDNGEPGTNNPGDTLAFDVKDNGGNLWFSNSWKGVQTVIYNGSQTGKTNTLYAPLIQGGNLQVH